MDMFVLLVDGRPDAVLGSLELANTLALAHRAAGRVVAIVSLAQWGARNVAPGECGWPNPPQEKTHTSAG